MNPRPLLNILDYSPIGLSFLADDRFKADLPQKAQFQTTFGVGQDDEDPRRFLVTLGCRFFAEAADHNIPYTADLGIEGHFYSAIKLTSDGVPESLVVNALTILYGIARGVMGQATAGGVNGRFILPTVFFNELVQDASTRTEDTNVIPDEVFAIHPLQVKRTREPEYARKPVRKKSKAR